MRTARITHYLRPLLIMLALLLAACGAPLPPATPILGTGPLDSAEAYLARGDEYAGRQDYDLAVADYTEAIRLRPDWAEAYNNRGYSEWWGVDGDAALADYNRAIALRPDYAYAYNNRGVVYMATGNAAQSIVDFTQAIALQPDFPQAYSNRANAYLRLGRWDLARADFQHLGRDPLPLMLTVCGSGLILLLVLAMGLAWLRRRTRIRPGLPS